MSIAEATKSWSGVERWRGGVLRGDDAFGISVSMSFYVHPYQARYYVAFMLRKDHILDEDEA